MTEDIIRRRYVAVVFRAESQTVYRLMIHRQLTSGAQSTFREHLLIPGNGKGRSKGNGQRNGKVDYKHRGFIFREYLSRGMSGLNFLIQRQFDNPLDVKVKNGQGPDAVYAAQRHQCKRKQRKPELGLPEEYTSIFGYTVRRQILRVRSRVAPDSVVIIDEQPALSFTKTIGLERLVRIVSPDVDSLKKTFSALGDIGIPSAYCEPQTLYSLLCGAYYSKGNGKQSPSNGRPAPKKRTTKRQRIRKAITARRGK